ncbi:MAG: hypothetical protein AAFX05_11145 [Planctomycetota bacterium]
MRRRGALLLEAGLAVALFAMAGLAILGMLRNAAAGLAAERERLHAVDLATSALAAIEAGIETAESLDGEVPRWTDEQASTGFEDRPPEPSGWLLEIETDESVYDGLTVVTVHVVRTGALGQAPQAPTYALTRLLRLGRVQADDEAPVDDLLREIEEIERRSSGGRR